MNLLEALRIAFENLVINRLRSILTMLGVIIGVSAVITLLALGDALQQVVSTELEGLGSNLIFLFAGTNDPQINSEVPPELTNEDVEALSRPLNLPAVSAVAAEYSRQATIVYQGRSSTALVSGVSPTYPDVRNAQVAAGWFFNERQVQQRARVAVIGAEVYELLFPQGGNPLGQDIRINQLTFRIIGVMAERGGSFASNEDDIIFVPISTAQERLFPRPDEALNNVDVTVVYIQARDKASIDLAIDQVTTLLRQRHQLVYEDNNFTLVTQEDLLSSFGVITGSITIFLGAIAAISLLVGGIGIMNIMLVSVTERTREIGLRKAVGARKRDVLTQFLAEAATLSFGSGIVGIILGYTLAAVSTILLQRYGLDVEATVRVQYVLLATLTSVAVGIFFGFYPAVRASNLSPIDALRHN